MSSGIVVSRSLVQQSMIHPNTNQQQPVLTYQSVVYQSIAAVGKHSRSNSKTFSKPR
jgi:hypothetical protein